MALVILPRQSTGAIGGCVEGDFDFDAPVGSYNMDALIGSHLHRGGKRGGATTGKDEHAADGAINAKLRIDVKASPDFMRLFAEKPAGKRNGIAADIHQRSTTPFGSMSDIVGIVIEKAEKRLDGVEFADLAFAHHFISALPLGVEAIHEGFHEFQLRVFARGSL